MSKNDFGKVKYSLIEPAFSENLACVLTFGAYKYGPADWKNTENAELRYYDALMRHIEAWRNGESIDEESGLPHLAHAAANLMFLHHFDRMESMNAEKVSTKNKDDMGVTSATSERNNGSRTDDEEESELRFRLTYFN